MEGGGGEGVTVHATLGVELLPPALAGLHLLKHPPHSLCLTLLPGLGREGRGRVEREGRGRVEREGRGRVEREGGEGGEGGEREGGEGGEEEEVNNWYKTIMRIHM